MMGPRLEPWGLPLATGPVHLSPESQWGCDLEKMAWVLGGAMATQRQQALGIHFLLTQPGQRGSSED